MNLWSRLGALLMAAGVLLGAFGAHGLKDRLDPALLEIYHTAVFYHLIHALALVAMGGCGIFGPERGRRLAGGLLTAGVAVFSGSLYLLAVTGVRLWGAVTPVGGVLLVAGWVAAAWSPARRTAE